MTATHHELHGMRIRGDLFHLTEIDQEGTVENVKVSSILTNKRWTTEITARDALYLEKLGVKLTV